MLPRTEGDVLALAYAGGVECTLAELVGLWAGNADGILDRVLRVQERIQSLNLTLHPSEREGDLDTPRVMRCVRANTLSDRLPTLTAQESGIVEFKESLYANMKRLRADNVMESDENVTKSALKSVAAFINSEGGTLLLGINDSGDASDGIEQDMKVRSCNRDRLELGLRDLLRTRFVGVDAESHSSLEWAELEGHPVLGIDVVPSLRPAFLNTKGAQEYFVRRGNRTVSLSLSEFYEQALTRYCREPT